MATEQLFGFNTQQKKSLAEYVAENGGGGGTLSGASDFDEGLITPIGVGDVMFVAAHSEEEGATWTNVNLSTTVLGLITATNDARELENIDDAVDALDLLAKFNLLLDDMKAKGLMDPAAP